MNMLPNINNTLKNINVKIFYIRCFEFIKINSLPLTIKYPKIKIKQIIQTNTFKPIQTSVIFKPIQILDKNKMVSNIHH